MSNKKPVASKVTWLLAATASASALGQTAPQTGEEATGNGRDRGHGLAHRAARLSSTSPMVTTSKDELAQTGTVNIENALNQLPQFVQGQGQSTVGAVALAGRASLNLRGLGETRNLVLLDGRRLPLSNANAVVDVNMIPQFILEGVETITGGASAVYGSDAMSGVVNFKSLHDFSGLHFDVRSGHQRPGRCGYARCWTHRRIRHRRRAWQRADVGEFHGSR
jgi:outer membrane receptor protein involved in Fe transport